jgi:hypothetical protein
LREVVEPSLFVFVLAGSAAKEGRAPAIKIKASHFIATEKHGVFQVRPQFAEVSELFHFSLGPVSGRMFIGVVT